MSLWRRLLRWLRPIRAMRTRGYGREVLYAGWVNPPLKKK